MSQRATERFVLPKTIIDWVGKIKEVDRWVATTDGSDLHRDTRCFKDLKRMGEFNHREPCRLTAIAADQMTGHYIQDGLMILVMFSSS
ncbi:hypothetical protein DF22_001532 [Xylella fastidiosa]|nr:hypothetical protein P910_002090 [Xylella fastidiosa Mul-MD]KFA41908.1 hypothetical protein DF22_001532 [Xylella fastidiosa]MDS9989894.1 hypothetical protein [Xylella fastidiosa]